MPRRFISLVATTMVLVAARTEAEFQTPTSLPPLIVLAKASIEDGRVRVQFSVTKMVPYTVTTMVRADTGFFVPRKSLHHKACTIREPPLSWMARP